TAGEKARDLPAQHCSQPENDDARAEENSREQRRPPGRARRAALAPAFARPPGLPPVPGRAVIRSARQSGDSHGPGLLANTCLPTGSFDPITNMCSCQAPTELLLSELLFESFERMCYNGGEKCGKGWAHGGPHRSPARDPKLHQAGSADPGIPPVRAGDREGGGSE